MYYLGTYNQASYYLSKVNSGENYGPGTTNWAQIHTSNTNPSNCAILKHPKYKHSNMQLVDTLPQEFILDQEI